MVGKAVVLGQLPDEGMTPSGLLPQLQDLGFLLTVLGGFRLSSGTTIVGVPQGSQRLLAFLALRGGVVKRVAVAGALWPDATERHAYANLRATIARLDAKRASSGGGQ